MSYDPESPEFEKFLSTMTASGNISEDDAKMLAVNALNYDARGRTLILIVSLINQGCDVSTITKSLGYARLAAGLKSFDDTIKL